MHCWLLTRSKTTFTKPRFEVKAYRGSSVSLAERPRPMEGDTRNLRSGGRGSPGPHVHRSATETPGPLRPPGEPPPATLGPRPAPTPGGWYLGGPDLADAGFLGQATDAADEAERVAELLPAGLEHGALGGGHELGRVARPTAPRHGHSWTAPPTGGEHRVPRRGRAGRCGRGDPQGRPAGLGRWPRRILRRRLPGCTATGKAGRGRGAAVRGSGAAATECCCPVPRGCLPPLARPSRSRSSSPEVTRLDLSPPPETETAVAFRSKK